MKRLAVLTFLASAALHAAEIPNGTHVLLRMLNSVNTRTAVAGNLVYLETAIPIAIGGQDCHEKPSGAFTGDISAEMLRDAGVFVADGLGQVVDAMRAAMARA